MHICNGAELGRFESADIKSEWGGSEAVKPIEATVVRCPQSL